MLPGGCGLSSRRVGRRAASWARPVAEPHGARRLLLLGQVLLGMVFFPDLPCRGQFVCRRPFPGPFIYGWNLSISYPFSTSTQSRCPPPAPAAPAGGAPRAERVTAGGRAVAGPPCQIRPGGGGRGPPAGGRVFPPARRGAVAASPSPLSRREPSRRGHSGLRAAGGTAGEGEPGDGRAGPISPHGRKGTG